MTKSCLWIQANRTAEALSQHRGIVYLDRDCLSSWEWATARGADCSSRLLPNSHPEWGYFMAMDDGTFKIGVNPDIPLEMFYWVILHETAHAYLTDVILPDHEEAANELVSIWAVSIARRYPADERELVQWLGMLETYHERTTDLYLFSKGTNRGRMIPNAALVRSLAASRDKSARPIQEVTT